jgi:hypothetical protein
MNLYLSSPIAAANPRISPNIVPTTPITTPCAKKILRIDFAGIPIALRIPISLVLSATTMVSVLTMLKAATSTMSRRITPIPSFSSLSAWKSELFCCCQSTVRNGQPSAPANCGATIGACQRSSVLTSIPVTA